MHISFLHLVTLALSFSSVSAYGRVKRAANQTCTSTPGGGIACVSNGGNGADGEACTSNGAEGLTCVGGNGGNGADGVTSTNNGGAGGQTCTSDGSACVSIGGSGGISATAGGITATAGGGNANTGGAFAGIGGVTAEADTDPSAALTGEEGTTGLNSPPNLVGRLTPRGKCLIPFSSENDANGLDSRVREAGKETDLKNPKT